MYFIIFMIIQGKYNFADIAVEKNSRENNVLYNKMYYITSIVSLIISIDKFKLL